MADITLTDSDGIGKCCAAESLTTSFSTVRFITNGASKRKVLINCLADSWISDSSGGTNKYPIKAGVDFQLQVGHVRPMTIYLAAQTGTTTAYIIVSE